MSPKVYSRSVRLQRALTAAEPTSDWVRVALDAGYYDQAHLINDFRALLGVTPGGYVRRAREPDLHCS